MFLLKKVPLWGNKTFLWKLGCINYIIVIELFFHISTKKHCFGWYLYSYSFLQTGV